LNTLLVPDRPLDPPDNARDDHDWAAVFRCWIGDDDLPVLVVCNVTINDEIDFDSVQVFLEPKTTGHVHNIDITRVLNKMLRAEIEHYFELNFDNIYAYNH
jgi:hypothetical protein